MRSAALVAIALVAGCASRQPDPPRQMVWAHAEAPPAVDTSAPAIDASAPVAATPPPRPITPVLPVLRLENLRFRDVSTCERGECRIEGLSPFAPTSVAVDDGATALPPAAGWVQVIRPGALVVIPRRAEVDVLGVALVGDVVLDRVGAPRSAQRHAAPWTAFALPEGGAVLRAGGTEPVAALLVTATGTASTAGRANEYATRDLATLEDLSWAGGAMHARIAFGAPDSPRASLGVLIASDDAPVAEHAHGESWEMLVAFSAAGRLHLPAQTIGDRALPARDRTVTGGAIAYVPAGVRHAWAPDGTHPLIAVQVYAPAGPEQRFRALAR